MCVKSASRSTCLTSLDKLFVRSRLRSLATSLRWTFGFNNDENQWERIKISTLNFALAEVGERGEATIDTVVVKDLYRR